jgi:hypothetical protein
MKKPAHDAPVIEQLAYGMCMIQDERQEACIHCKDVSYAIHHKDGVCHKCQKEGLPGRAQIARRARLKTQAIHLTGLVAALFVIYHLLF